MYPRKLSGVVNGKPFLMLKRLKKGYFLYELNEHNRYVRVREFCPLLNKTTFSKQN